MAGSKCQLLLTFLTSIFAENKLLDGQPAKITSYIVDSYLPCAVVSLWHNTLLLLEFSFFVGKNVFRKSKQLISTTTRICD